MSDATIGTGMGRASDSEGSPSEGRVGRILYRLAIFVLFLVACYSTFEGLRALSGYVAVALILTGLFQGALLGSALFLGRDLANYASGRKGARISAGGRGVRYGLTILIYCLCLVLCVFFAFTFWHRLLLDRGTGLDLTLPKITQLASDFVAGDLTDNVQDARRAEPRTIATKPPVAGWTAAVRRTNEEAATDAIAKTLADSIFQTEKRAAEERAELRKRANDAIIKESEAVRVQTERVRTASVDKETRDRRRVETEGRVTALRAAHADEGGSPAPSPAKTLPANGDAYRLTRNAACQSERKSGQGDCFNALTTALQAAESGLRDVQGQILASERTLREANETLAGARERLAAAQKRLDDNPALPMPTEPVAKSGEERQKLTAQNLDRFVREPTSSAFMTVAQDCTASADALSKAGKQGSASVACRSSEVEAEAAAFTDYVARHDAYMAACGERVSVGKAEAIERGTRGALRGITDQHGQQRLVDEALRKTLAEVVGDCVAKARSIGKATIKASNVEEAARSFVSGNVLDRDPQDRAFDAIASLFSLRGGLPVAGAAFLAVLQETLILCFAFLLHLFDHDRRAPAVPARQALRASGLRAKLDWRPDLDNDPPRVLAAKFLFTSLDVTSDGGGKLASDYAEGEPDKVAVNADAILKELARRSHAEERSGTWMVTREGVEDIEAIVIEHHDSATSGSTTSHAPMMAGSTSDAALLNVGRDLSSSGQGGRVFRTNSTGVTDGSSSERAPQPPAQNAPADAGTHSEPRVARPAEAAPLPTQRRQGRQRDAGYAFRRGRE